MSACAENSLVDQFVEACSAKLTLGVPASKYTTISAGGEINYLVEPDNSTELIAALKFLAANGQKVMVLGAGSNLIVSDDGVDAWVFKLAKGFRFYEEVAAATFRVGAAMSLMNLSRRLSDIGLSGLEFAGGIPASIGGAVRMNAGAHGGEMANVVKEISFVRHDGASEQVKACDLKWSYRKCSLPSDAIVTEILLEMSPSSPELTKSKRQECLKERKERQPLHFPSFGSVFKNPADDLYAGALIEEVGLKGFSLGNAQVSSMHANWIVNPTRQAKSSEIVELIEHVKSSVAKAKDVILEPEVVVWS